MKIKNHNRGKYIAYAISVILLVFLIDTGIKAYAQNEHRQQIQEEESFRRPEPSKPISPQVPSVNRYQDDKIFLEYADSLYKVTNRRDTVERQILKGNVKFRQAGLWMFCDSAYYYPEANSLDAFSNVRMEQGDTLFVYADKLFYNGDEHLAKLKNGPTENKVILINKDVTLTTDSLDYDMQVDLGWYTRWGTIDDKVNTLTSLYGQYSPKTKMAEFFKDVVLVNNKDGFTMLTDTLYYSTETHIANIQSRTVIQSQHDTIITNQAVYYTDTGDADLLTRSMIIHRDSTGNVTTLEGDSIIYDATTRISRAYMYKDPFKHSTPMVITDTAQKTKLIGGFGIYNDSTREALATIYPLLMEYSQGDTLFLRADTIKTYIVTEMVADKRRKTKSGFPEHNGFPIVMKDSLGMLWIDTTFFNVRIPYVETPLLMLLKEAPPYTPPTEPEIIEEQDIQEEINENVSAGPEMQSQDSIKNLVEELDIVSQSLDLDSIQKNDTIISFSDSIIYPKDSLPDLSGGIIGINDSITIAPDTIPSEAQVDSIPYESHVVLAYHRGRFFKKDMQGVADSMVFVEKDSMLYMFRKPIVWSEERQVTGNRIDVHFNDSTTDWAYLPEFGLMSEYVDEDFYNQIYGKEIKAYFKDSGLRRMDVSGNVETIFLPQEEDSTFNRLVNAESSYMEVYLDSNKLDWLKMWPEVSGTVTPIFLVKRNQMYLQKFKWWGFLRPEREWYGDQIRWADNLGEVPEDLEQYFLTPSDFGEPKSFSGTRFTPPPSSLPPIEGDIMPAASILELDENLTLEDILEEDEEEEEEADSNIELGEAIEASEETYKEDSGEEGEMEDSPMHETVSKEEEPSEQLSPEEIYPEDNEESPSINTEEGIGNE